jgi:FAD synthetase
METVLAFGTFDGLHLGHHHFLRSAWALGDRLVVSVARDEHVRALKGKEPANDEETRLAAVDALKEVDEAILSDEELGSFHVIEDIEPDIIAIGHDQDDLAEAIQEWLDREGREAQIIRIDKHE